MRERLNDDVYVRERLNDDVFRISIDYILELRASEASETVLWVDNAKSGICYMYICIYVCMYGLYVCPLNARAGNFFLQKTRLFRLDPSLF